MFYYWLYDLTLIDREINGVDFSYPSPYSDELDDLIYDAAVYCINHNFNSEY